MPEFTVDFEVFCGRCGAGLCNQSDTRKSWNRSMNQVTVEPCEKCIEAERREAYDEGFAECEKQAADDAVA